MLQKHNQHTGNNGFTLVEMSIVLVVIGLTVSAIFVGQDLIKAAQVRKTVSMIQVINSAVNTFRLKFDCLPGDCNVASTYLPSAIDGDGNGQITLNTNSVPETANLWNHLSSSGLISGNFQPFNSIAAYDVVADDSGTPSLPLPNLGLSPLTPNNFNINLQYTNYYDTNTGAAVFNHYFYLAGFLNVDYPAGADLAAYVDLCFPNCPFILASLGYAIDQKIDDGVPNAGRVVQFANDLCNVAGNRALYNLNSTNPICLLFITASF